MALLTFPTNQYKLRASDVDLDISGDSLTSWLHGTAVPGEVMRQAVAIVVDDLKKIRVLNARPAKDLD